MSNVKTYTSAAPAEVPVPNLGAIWHVRGNEVLYDYADTRVSTDDYAAGLKQALGATGPTSLQAGDKIIVGPGLFTGDGYICVVSDVLIEFHGTTLQSSTATFGDMLEFTGNNTTVRGLRAEIGATTTGFSRVLSLTDNSGCLLEDCHVDGKQQSNSATGGNGLYMSFGCSTNTVRNCSASNLDGPTTTDGRGMYVQGNDHTIDGFEAIDNKYIGIRCSNTSRLTMRRLNLRNMGATKSTPPNQSTPRAINVDGSTLSDYIEISDSTFYSNTPNGHAYLGFGTTAGTGQISHVKLTNVNIINDNNISPGVSFNLPNRMQCMKLENIDSAYLENCTFKHGSNSDGAGTAYSFSFDSALQNMHADNCWLSGGYSGGQLPGQGRIRFEGCDLGGDSVTMLRLFDVGNGKVSLNECNITLDGSLTQELIGVAGASPVAGDSFSMHKCNVTTDKATDMVACDVRGLMNANRRLKFSENVLTNSGTGNFPLSTDQPLYLGLSTDANGNLLWDSSDPMMPAPPFTGVVGQFGQKIINVRYTGSSDTPEWIWTGVWEAVV